MNNSIIENSIKETITWQFDKSNRLISLLTMLSDFGVQSTEDVWSNIGAKLNLTNDDTISDLSLILIGMILGMPRFEIIYPNSTRQQISIEFYRKLLLGVWRLYSSAGTLKDYIAFSSTVFDGHLKIVQKTENYSNMVLNTSLEGVSSSSEMYLAYSQFPKYCVPVQAGVSLKTSGNILIDNVNTSLGFSTQRSAISSANTKKFAEIKIVGTPNTTIPANASVRSSVVSDIFTFKNAITIPSSGEVYARVKSTYQYNGETYAGLNIFRVVNSSLNPISGVSHVYFINRSIPEQNVGNFLNTSFYWAGDFISKDI